MNKHCVCDAYSDYIQTLCSYQTCKRCLTFLGSKISQLNVPQYFVGENGQILNILGGKKGEKGKRGN